MRVSIRTVLLSALTLTAMAQTNQPAWVTRSNRNTQILIDIDSRYSPESASENGVPGLDNQITILSADRHDKLKADFEKARTELQSRLAAEKDPLVKQDLEILIKRVDQNLRDNDVVYKTFLPYGSVGETVYSGIKSLLDDQIAENRRPAAVERLKKYTGLEPGFTAMTTMAEERFRERLKTPGLLGPSKEHIDDDLKNTDTYINGIGLLMEKYNQKDYSTALAKLKEELAGYDAFIRREVLPKARTDFRLPPDIYRMQLDSVGVDYSPEDLKQLAHQGFDEIIAEMKPIAARVAQQRKLPSSDYRDVIRQLKKEQLNADDIMPHYQKRLAEIEDILRKNNLGSVTK